MKTFVEITQVNISNLRNIQSKLAQAHELIFLPSIEVFLMLLAIHIDSSINTA